LKSVFTHGEGYFVERFFAGSHQNKCMTTQPTIIPWPSPNYDARPPGTPADILLLHYTGMPTAEAALRRLTDPASKVSAHYTIDEEGAIYAHVDESQRAWHAGVSSWAGQTDINARSIGIELVNPGHEFGYRDFPQAQIEALMRLARAILARHPIPEPRVLGHSDVAPARKQDPGEKFPWAALAKKGIGLWPAHAAVHRARTLHQGDEGADVGALQERLKCYGYGLPVSGRYDEATKLVVAAFQRHFRPRLVSGEADGETQGVLGTLLEVAGLEP
jgi:N-acetylmuramoyl-L-alanine amidase